MPRTKKTSSTKNPDRLIIGVGIIISIIAVFILVSSLTNRGILPTITKIMPQSFQTGGDSVQSADFAGSGYNTAPAYTEESAQSRDGVRLQNNIPRQKIESGSLSLLVDNVETTLANIRTIAENLGGYTEYSNIYESDRRTIIGSVTVRVPAEQFQGVMIELKNLAVKVDRESTDSRDITTEVIDTQARLANLKALETQYRAILKNATKIEDTIRVTQELANVRTQIESLESQLEYMSQAVDLATITVELHAVADVQVFGLTWKPLIVVKQAIQDMVAGIITYIETLIRFVLYIPVLLLWIATVGLVIFGIYQGGRTTYKQLRRK